jgi:hypothetical protein
MLVVSAVALGMIGFLHPVIADQGAPSAVFPGFTAVDAHAQGQLATGYLFAVGDELTRLVGAAVEINGPPAGAQGTAAFIQRGAGGTYVYGVAGGGGNGKGGALPDPPPGEADAFFPANPQQGSWEGPLTGAAKTQVIDGRFTSKVTATPTARGDAAVTQFIVPGALEIEQAVVNSHSEPTDNGVVAESVSVLRGLTIGALHIESLTSRAYAFFPAQLEAPKGIARTVVEGATVNGTPVQITDQGVVAGDKPNPGPQGQINDALAKSGFPQIRLTPSTVNTGGDGSFNAVTGVLQVIHRDPKLGTQNPQGFEGGGFSVGGAEVSVLAGRCAPTCGGALDLSAPPVAPGGAAFDAGPPGGGGYGSSGSSSTTAVAPTGPSTSSELPSGSTEPSAPVAPLPSTDTSTAPPATQTAPQSSQQAPTTPPRQANLAAAQLTPDMAGWMRDAYLALGAGVLIVLLAGTLLIRTR